MSYGFDLGGLSSTDYGLSYVDSFVYTGAATTIYYTATMYEFATTAHAIILPQENIPATKIPIFPYVVATINPTTRTITVSVSGGNVTARILVFVR